MNILTTGVGSLPWESADEAAIHACNAYTMPFLPEKASLNEPTIQRPVEPSQHPYWHAFTAALTSAQLRSRPSGQPRPIKLQLLGPHTASRLANVNRESLFDEISILTQAYVRALRYHLAKTRYGSNVYSDKTHQDKTQSDKMPRDKACGGKAYSSEIWFTWDEPHLPEPNDHAYWKKLAQIAQALALDGIYLGLHCCATFNLSQLLPLAGPILWSFDMNVTDTQSPTAVAALRNHLQKGRRLILGCIDTRPQTCGTAVHSVQLKTLFSSLAEELAAGDGLIALSGGCGTGLRSPAFETVLAAELTSLAARSCL